MLYKFHISKSCRPDLSTRYIKRSYARPFIYKFQILSQTSSAFVSDGLLKTKDVPPFIHSTERSYKYGDRF